ncbi:MAG: hypothetical protein DYH15_12145 [Nitrosomonas sp. PRO4]|nr:hypothetical protein [Nitrosomonas sp. PRO4]
MNYQALGQYHAFKKQAEDAANKRFAVLYNLSTQMRNLADDPTKSMDMTAINAAIEEARKAECEMIAATGCANEAAKLCGETEITARSFKR